MTDKTAEIITKMINDLRAIPKNDVEIAIDLLGAATPVMIEAAGTASTAIFLHNLADLVQSSNLDNLN